MKRINLYLAYTVLLFTSLSPGVNAALVRYEYTGNPFDNFHYQGPSNIHYDFTLDDSLAPKNGHFSKQYSLNQDDRTYLLTIDFDTDLNGEITSWNIQYIDNFDDINGGGHGSYYHLFMTQYDSSLLKGSDRDYFIYFPGEWDLSNSNNPGIWTRSLISVPLPSGILFFGSALGVFYVSLRSPRRYD
jgi:hypothetical protein